MLSTALVLGVLRSSVAKHTAINASCNGAAETDADVHATCEDFCASRCAFVQDFELPVKKTKLTLFRETPINVTTLDEKNNGDTFGDVGFYLTNHNLPYLCANDPNSSTCTEANAIERNSQNNIFLQFTVEVDGDFGPYQMCNPEHGWDTKNWECLTYCEEPPNCQPWSSQKDNRDWMGPTCFCDNGHSNATVGRHNQSDMHHHSGGNASTWPKQCVAANLHDISGFGYCLTGTVLKSIPAGPDATIAECCSLCGETHGCLGWTMKHGEGKGCDLLGDPGHDWTKMDPGHPCISAYNFQSGTGHISDGVLGGFWYSLPTAGECKATHDVGTDGCTWKLEKMTKWVNSSCVGSLVEKGVEAHGKSCFEKCGKDAHDVTSLCYTVCFAETVNGNVTTGLAPMPIDQVAAPFRAAFAAGEGHGGCANLMPSAHQYQYPE